MDRHEFINAAWRRIGQRREREIADVEAVDSLLDRCYEDGFTLPDAVKCAQLTEHISPHLSERYACDRIAEIMAKYIPRKGKQ